MGTAARVSQRTVKSAAQQAVDKANECVDVVSRLQQNVGKLGGAFDDHRLAVTRASGDLEERIDRIANRQQDARTALLGELRAGKRFLEGAGFLDRLRWLFTGTIR